MRVPAPSGRACKLRKSLAKFNRPSRNASGARMSSLSWSFIFSARLSAGVYSQRNLPSETNSLPLGWEYSHRMRPGLRSISVPLSERELSGPTNTGVVDLAGVLQFDGQGNVTANWTQASNTATANVSATGTYTVSAACLGSLPLTDTANQKYAGSVSVFGAAANNFEWIVANPQLIFRGVGHAAFVNPGRAVVNAASYLAGETPAGSVFSVFGSNLATRDRQATSTPLPTTVLTTTVTVNGELAPLFYVDPNQINAQMPEDIKPGVATVVVQNGDQKSNAVAVMVPAAGTP